MNTPTPPELAAIALVAEGLTNKGIAVRLNKSEHTIHQQLSEAAARVGARDRTHLAVLALRRGWIA